MPKTWQPHHFVALTWRKVLNKNKKISYLNKKKQVLISTWQQEFVASMAKAEQEKKEVGVVAFWMQHKNKTYFYLFLLCSKGKQILFIYFFFFLKTIFNFYLFFFSCQLLHT